ncbi:MAG: hypothetical protein HZB29_06300 [Nitrospinae bacterium]|nr:hypothetical protein [Nitrospinota bacterium]
MEVSAAGGGKSDFVQQASQGDKGGVAVLKHALAAEKAAGAQMIDMIKKAGSTIDTVA